MNIFRLIVVGSLIAFLEFLAGKFFEEDPLTPYSTYKCVISHLMAAGSAALYVLWAQPPLIFTIVLLAIAYIAFAKGTKYSLKNRFFLNKRFIRK